MPADASIYNLIRPQATVKLEDPDEIQAKRMTLRNLMQQGQMGEIQMRGALRDEQTGESLRGLFGRNPNPTDAEVMAIDPLKAGPAYLKQKREGVKADADLQKVDSENFIAITDAARKDLATIRDQPSWQAHRDQMIQAAGMFKTPEMRNKALQAAQSLPVQFDPNYIRNSLVKAEELFTPKLVERTDGQRKWMEDTNPFTNPAILTRGPTQMQQTPESVASNATAIRGQNLTDARAREPVYDPERGGFASRPQPGKETTFIPVKDAPPGQKQVIATREDTDKLRQEFEGKPSVKNYRDVIPIAAAGRKAPDTRSGDIQMAYAVGKILDPNSVVREGELKLVGDAATVMGKIEGELRTLTQGKGRLTPETRDALNAMLSNAVEQRKASYEAEKTSYGGIVQRRGYKPEDVFIDVPEDRRAQSPQSTPETKVVNGKTYVKQNGQWYEAR